MRSGVRKVAAPDPERSPCAAPLTEGEFDPSGHCGVPLVIHGMMLHRFVTASERPAWIATEGRDPLKPDWACACGDSAVGSLTYSSHVSAEQKRFTRKMRHGRPYCVNGAIADGEFDPFAAVPDGSLAEVKRGA